MIKKNFFKSRNPWKFWFGSYKPGRSFTKLQSMKFSFCVSISLFCTTFLLIFFSFCSSPILHWEEFVPIKPMHRSDCDGNSGNDETVHTIYWVLTIDTLVIRCLLGTRSSFTCIISFILTYPVRSVLYFFILQMIKLILKIEIIFFPQKSYSWWKIKLRFSLLSMWVLNPW